jgi:hypothetical protein
MRRPTKMAIFGPVDAASSKQMKGVVGKDAVQDRLARLSSEVCSRPCDKDTAALVRKLSM